MGQGRRRCAACHPRHPIISEPNRAYHVCIDSSSRSPFYNGAKSVPIDSDNYSDNHCLQAESIACCSVRGKPYLKIRDYYIWSTCLNGLSLERKRRNGNAAKLAQYHEGVRAKTANMMNQPVAKPDSQDPYFIPSGQLECPEIVAGRAARQPFKFCCLPPWENSPMPRSCKDCKFFIVDSYLRLARHLLLTSVDRFKQRQAM